MVQSGADFLVIKNHFHAQVLTMTTGALQSAKPLVTVITVTMNSQETIGQCIDSVLREAGSGLDLEMIVVDNGSKDNTLQIVKEKGVQLIIEQTNLGFCAANNNGVHKASGQYILFLNPDAMITPEYLVQGIDLLKAEPKVGFLTGKVLRMYPDGSPVLSGGYPVFDTAGINLRANRQAVDIGMGEEDHGQYDRPAIVSAICGAVCLCKAEVLAELAVDGEVFDELFFIYKEDVDLGWRAQRLGWTCLYTPKIVAYHARGWQSGLQTRSSIPKQLRFHSYKNRRMMILKNEKLSSLPVSFFPIIGFEIASLCYLIINEPYLLETYNFILRNLRHILRWRHEIQSRAQGKRGIP